MAYEAEREAAIGAVEKASLLCRAVQAELITEGTMSKKDRSPVTVADFGAQAVVTHELAAALGGFSLVGEESADELRQAENTALRDQVVVAAQRALPGIGGDEILDLIDHGTFGGGPSGRHWTLDPIDGTKGFLRREQYAIALALIEDGEVVLGVLGCPSLPRDADRPDGDRGCLFVAVKGQGTFARPLDGGDANRIRVQGVSDPSKASLCESVEKEHSSQSDSARVAERLGIQAPPFRIDSQCKYAAVARGNASIYLRLPTRKGYEEKIWDHAAGSIVVTEAGGQVSDVRGNALDFSIGRTLRDNLGVVVTNGALHDPVVAAVREVLGV